MEGFIKYLKSNFINCPDEITIDNVHIKLCSAHHNLTSSFLKESLKGCYLEITKWLLTLQPSVGYFEIVSCLNLDYLKLLLEANVDLNGSAMIGMNHVMNFFNGHHQKIKFFEMLVDYGSNTFYMDISHTKEHYEYAAIVKRRVSECRKAILALLRCCMASSSYKKAGRAAFGPFGSLRDVMIQMATQVWGLRGGEGVGPRGHVWFLKPTVSN